MILKKNHPLMQKEKKKSILNQNVNPNQSPPNLIQNQNRHPNQGRKSPR